MLKLRMVDMLVKYKREAVEAPQRDRNMTKQGQEPLGESRRGGPTLVMAQRVRLWGGATEYRRAVARGVSARRAAVTLKCNMCYVCA